MDDDMRAVRQRTEDYDRSVLDRRMKFVLLTALGFVTSLLLWWAYTVF